MRYPGYRGTLAASVAICAVAAATPAIAQTRSFNVPAQSAATAIPELARQADVQILISESAARDKRTNAVKGKLTADQAVRRLIAGTGLRIASSDGRTYTLANAAGSGPTQATPGNDGQAAAREDDAADGQQIAEIVVTGTNIRGSAPAGSPLIRYDAEEMRRTGAGSVDDFLRKVPQNFSVLDTSTYIGGIASGSMAAANFTRGAAVSLRGLGPEGTLALINGQRLAPAGLQSAYADISVIPMTAIERVEILGDGASAIYGSDAIGGVVNFILQQRLNGGITSLRYGTSTRGGGEEIRVSQAVGVTDDRGRVMIAYEFFDQNRIDASERGFVTQRPGRRVDLTPDRQRHSVLVSSAYHLTPSTEVSFDGLYSRRTYHQVYYSQSLPEQVDDSGQAATTQASLGVAQELGDWRARLNGTYSGSTVRRVTVQPSFTTPSNGFIRYKYLDFAVDGPLVTLPGGPLLLSVGASYRKEEYRPTDGRTVGMTLARNVESAFAELRVPVIGPENGLPFAKSINLSAALRHDRYSGIGNTTNPKVGVEWNVNDWLRLRGSYARSFRAPLLFNLAPALQSAFTYDFPNPASPTGLTNTLVDSSSYNPDLRPERSRSFTLGFDVQPTGRYGPRLSVTYFDVDFRDRITTPPLRGSIFLVYSQLDSLSSFMNFSPSQADLASYFASPYFVDLAGRGPGDVKAILDFRPQNLKSQVSRGLDIEGSYAVPLGRGTLTADANINYMIDLKVQATPDLAVANLLDQVSGPLSFRARGGLTWANDDVVASLKLNHARGYRNILITPNEHIDAYTTADLHLSWKIAETTVALDIDNLFDVKPPVVHTNIPGAYNLGFDAVNASARGRYVALGLTHRW
jgi:outer membrane receptor protein involved in Fe transport